MTHLQHEFNAVIALPVADVPEAALHNMIAVRVEHILEHLALQQACQRALVLDGRQVLHRQACQSDS